MADDDSTSGAGSRIPQACGLIARRQDERPVGAELGGRQPGACLDRRDAEAVAAESAEDQHAPVVARGEHAAASGREGDADDRPAGAAQEPELAVLEVPED